MSQNKKPLTVLHDEITEWKSNVELVRSEISTFQKQLSEIASKNKHEEVMKGVEHFQNQFTRQLEVSDELLHDLHAADHELAEKTKNGEDSDKIFTKENTGLKDRAETYSKLFLELKNEFHLFLEKRM
ncbi:MAG: hypothetical protein M3R50_05175 [Bacteroidota bacterium]|nr:hypothetical protein [Bacteroidota bacterium]